MGEVGLPEDSYGLMVVAGCSVLQDWRIQWVQRLGGVLGLS